MKKTWKIFDNNLLSCRKYVYWKYMTDLRIRFPWVPLPFLICCTTSGPRVILRKWSDQKDEIFVFQIFGYDQGSKTCTDSRTSSAGRLRRFARFIHFSLILPLVIVAGRSIFSMYGYLFGFWFRQQSLWCFFILTIKDKCLFLQFL